MILLGIDPDLNGGLAVIDTATRTIIRLDAMPVWEPPVKGNRWLDTIKAWQIIQTAKASHGARAAILEAAIVKPQVGKGGANAMMGSVGRIHQTYGALKCMCELVFGRSGVIHAWPSTWKKEMGLTADKGDSRVAACNLFPTHHKLLGKVKNTGMAEAALLTEWGKTKLSLDQK